MPQPGEAGEVPVPTVRRSTREPSRDGYGAWTELRREGEADAGELRRRLRSRLRHQSHAGLRTAYLGGAGPIQTSPTPQPRGAGPDWVCRRWRRSVLPLSLIHISE